MNKCSEWVVFKDLRSEISRAGTAVIIMMGLVASNVVTAADEASVLAFPDQYMGDVTVFGTLYF